MKRVAWAGAVQISIIRINMKVNLKHNLEQIRAKNALAACSNSTFGGKNNGEVVKKIPTMIRENGFLGALAFAIEKETGYTDVFQTIITHLKTLELVENNINNCNDLLKLLVERPHGRLRRVTEETMAYLNYLRRFAKQ